MKKIRTASLTVALILWSAFLVDRAYMLGQNTQFNRDLWNSTTNTEPTPIVPPNNQLFTYLEERRNFAFGIEGDWEVNKYNRYAKELRMPSAEQKLSSYNAESKTK